MKTLKLALLGFGNVGQALGKLLLEKEAELQEIYGITFRVAGIATGSHGAAINPQGIELASALAKAQAGESLDALSVQKVQDSEDFIRRCPADVLFETTPVNYQTGEPAISYIRAGLEKGMHVATANKGPVVHAYQSLSALAQAQGRKFFFESAVMDGAPIFSLFRDALPAANVRAFRGILNSTTNLLLTRMEEGESLDDAIGYAQSVGIAESDPSGDVDGWDAAIKVAALVTVVMGVPLLPSEVNRTGIRGVGVDAVTKASAENKRWKLVCEAQRDGDSVRAKVSPQLVGADSPLYNVMGTSSILQVESDVLGKLSLLEEDPSPATTAYGLLADFLNAVRS
ncbi:MAG: homoserine dehydrogenase [Chloroflexota bacterium]|nr:MAG: homoserine dehydrogenase [Chloroflexota bacterium]